MSARIIELFGNDISNLIFEYLAGEHYDDIHTAGEYINTDSQLFLFENENIDWSEKNISDVYEKGWVELVQHKKIRHEMPFSLIHALKSKNTEMIEYALETVQPNRDCLVSCISYKPEMFQTLWDKSDKSETKRKSCVNEFIKRGHLDLFQKFYKNPIDIDFTSIKIACIERRDNIVNFISNDNDILKHINDSCWNFLAYLIQNRYYDIVQSLLKTHPSLLTIKCINEACISGNEKILRMCLHNEPDYVDYAYYGADIACSKGYIDIIKVLDEYGYIFSEDSINGAVEAGHIGISKFLYKVHSLEPQEFSIEEATMKGHLEILKWLYNEKLINVIDINDVMLQACCSNKLDIVIWLCSKTIVPTQTCMDCACERNAIDVAKFLHKKYGMMCEDTSFDVTASEGYIEMIEWLTSINNKATVNAVDSCAATNEFEGLKWLHANRKEKGTHTAIENAVKRGNTDMVLYLLKNDYPVCSSETLLNAMKYYKGQPEIIECVLLVLEKHPDVFTDEMLTSCTTYVNLKKMLKFCDQDDISPQILYRIVLNGVILDRMKIIKLFLSRIIDVLDEEDKIELLNRSNSTYVKKYLEMRFITLPWKINYLFDIIIHINKDINSNFPELNDHWGSPVNNKTDVIENTRDVFYRIIDYIDEENINKYGAICYLFALQYITTNSICYKPIKFSIEMTKLIEQLEVTTKENTLKEFDTVEYGKMLKTVLKVVSLTPTMEIN